MTSSPELRELLPAVHQVRDAESGGPLRALLEVLEAEGRVVERDVARLLDNWFIETCDPWVVPYIGDLLGVRAVHPVGPGTASRAHVANTLAYRRRKGTAAVLEQLAFDLTGWRARVVEFFQLLATTQYAKHVRLGNLRTPDLRDADGLELLGGPFERAAHTAEVRGISSGRGRYDIPNVGLFLWRLQAYPLSRTTARLIGTPGDGTFSFSALGIDAPLFNPPRSERAVTDLAEEVHVPGALRRRALFDELEAVRQASVDGTSTPRRFFLASDPVLQVFTRAGSGDPFVEVPPERVLIADLSLWQRPPATKDYRRTDSPTPQPLPIAVAVDPELGRLTFPAPSTPVEVEVSSAHAFSADVGGGPYDRSGHVAPDFFARVQWQVGVSRAIAPVPGEIFATVAEAVQAWNAQPDGTVGVIAIMDSRTYEEDLTGADRIALPEGSELLVVAADWPEVDVSGLPTRVPGRFVPRLLRPHLRGDLSAVGTAAGGAEVPGRLRLDGLVVEGDVTILVGNLAALTLADCTVVVGTGSLRVNPSAASGKTNGLLRVRLERTICGPVTLPDTVPALSVTGSAIDEAGGGEAIDAAGAACSIESSTILGAVEVRSLDASNTIFTSTVTAERRQAGCVRFSFVPRDPATRTPRRHRCQPDLALVGVEDPDEQDLIVDRIVPVFASTEHGQPAYLQIAGSSPPEIRTGAEDGSEMGVFRALRQPHREANLRAALDEHLRFGLEAGIFFVT